MDHIACSASTRSEVVVPIFDVQGEVMAVLDVDSDIPDAFTVDDINLLAGVCQELGRRYGS